LSWVIIDIPAAIKNDLLFPPKPRSIEEQLVDKSRRQGSMIRSQQDSLSYHARKNQELSRELREKDALLEQKDKENKALKDRVYLLELLLYQATSRSKR
jgi:hypothetical protein